jgi:hypothetical protein
MRNVAITLFVIAVSAIAQMTGLPQAGVTLIGTPASPVIVDNSSLRILAYTLLYQGTAGRGSPHTFSMIGQLRNNPQAGIAPGTSFSEAQLPARTETRDASGNPPPPPTQVSLDSVLFENGVLVGPDKNNSFDAIAARLQAQKDVNSTVEAGAWPKLQQIVAAGKTVAPPRADSEIYQFFYRLGLVNAAEEMLRVRERSGDAGALQLAASMRIYPTITRGAK